MKILVFIKQVPDVSELRFDFATRRLIREGVPNIINPYDRRGVAEAIRLKHLYSAEVVVATMGPPQAREALAECLAAGVDRAVHLEDRAFAGADTLATARTLAMLARKEGFNAIFCGRNSIDGETGQVGPEVAEMLDIPHLSSVRRFDLRADGSFTAEAENDEGYDVVEGRLPVLISAAERLIKPIKAPTEAIQSVTKPIERLAASDLSPDMDLFGSLGSPTSVGPIRPSSVERKTIFWEDSNEEIALRLSKMIREAHEATHSNITRTVGRPLNGQPNGAIWIVAEENRGHLLRVTHELLSKGAEVAQAAGMELVVALIASNPKDHLSVFSQFGADRVFRACTPNYDSMVWTEVLSEAIAQHRPRYVLIPATARGRDYAPRVAARLGLGLTGDCIDITIDSDLQLLQWKPAFGGNLVAPIYSRTWPQIATVRPGVLEIARVTRQSSPEIVDLPVSHPNHRIRFVKTVIEAGDEGHALDEKPAVIGVGMGVGGPDKLPMIRELARAANAAIGASRRVVDAGWLPRQLQIGLTGKAIAARLYIAVGIRGALNHTVGIQRVGKVVAINSDPEAPIFKSADVGIVRGYEEVIPALIRAL